MTSPILALFKAARREPLTEADRAALALARNPPAPGPIAHPPQRFPEGERLATLQREGNARFPPAELRVTLHNRHSYPYAKVTTWEAKPDGQGGRQWGFKGSVTILGSELRAVADALWRVAGIADDNARQNRPDPDAPKHWEQDDDGRWHRVLDED